MVKIRCGKNEADHFLSNEEIQRNASVDKSIGSKNGDWFDALQFEEKHFENFPQNQSGEDGQKEKLFSFHVKYFPPKNTLITQNRASVLKIALAH